MLEIPMYQVDAFASRHVPWQPGGILPVGCVAAGSDQQAITAENSLYETGFLVKRAANYELRWFIIP